MKRCPKHYFCSARAAERECRDLHRNKTKWPPFRRRHIQGHFLDKQCAYIDTNTKVYSSGLNWKQVSICSGDGLAPKRRRAITWTCDDPVHWSIYMMTSSNGNIFRVTGHLGGGIHWSPVNFQHKGQWRGALMFSLICVWINGWENNREAGDLRRYRALYDVIVMTCVNRLHWVNGC